GVWGEWGGGNELAGFRSEIEEDRGGFDYGVGRSSRAVAVDDCRHFQQRIDPGKLRRELLTGPHVHWFDVVGQPAFLKHDENLLHVRTGQRVKVDHKNCLV